MLSAGRFGKLDLIAHSIFEGDKQKIEELKQTCSNEFKNKDCEYYLKYAYNLIQKGGDYIQKERLRLQGLLQSPSVSKDKKDGFRLKYNVLSGFVEGPERGSGYDSSIGSKQEL